MYFLTFANGNIILKPQGPRRSARVIKSVLDYLSFIIAEGLKHNVAPDSLHVSCSSSMDFPKEYTKDKATIRLADKLRSGDISRHMWDEIRALPPRSKLPAAQRKQLLTLKRYCERCVITTEQELGQWKGKIMTLDLKLSTKK
jgi:hypothetical protein